MDKKFDVAIVGCGFSGMLCAHFLRESGVDNFCVLEMGAGLGGVWSHGGVGGYPGAACDVPSYTYLPFLDQTGFIPSKKYVNQTEIADYAERLADHCKIRDHIRFSRKVLDVTYLDTATWQLTTWDTANDCAAETITAAHVVCANGPLSSPRMPEIPGVDRFQGQSFHTARWDYSVDLRGKRVGIIGTGASAAQVITSIVDDVDTLTVFQRTPTWAMPRDDEPTPPEIVDAFKVGGYSEKLRHVDWQGNSPPDPEALFTFDMLHDEEQNAAICAGIAKRIRKEVEDPELAELLTPDYPFFCKRVLFIDDYYSTFNKPHVTLINDPGGVVSVSETGVVMASGDQHDVEVLIFATGFDSNHIPFPVTGRDGKTLADEFGANEANNFQMTRPKSLWGLHVGNMPNFYMMIGPQSLNPVTNVTLLCEEQAKYIAGLVSSMHSQGHSEVEPTQAAINDWTERCKVSSDGKVWLRCNNWYMKSTKTDQQAGRERSQGMWMESYEDYLKHLLGAEGGGAERLLTFS
ncbi:MAG: NAD(P)/FAD-dependent oxidoreductase [Pseudomonadota bacterium]|nr:NAD(P)/FAD-dependent oxidoreductase [Pseudomonadota bacterium]MEC7137793.1 NAD(P)/FAD-dependent oxidoreductase [Pseudomonadota bacterium]MEC8696987.1 NAD(P)/FAD-dependent oxidoreductase [Pseudomonadota bacterium]MED5580557.1 NAD(P)/FAD-dependent oxidoreductase [Pseudomonadota bacterium]MEE2824680.1 NAD(P)/FAD-dependent oxidoreductase [Pseudomonadota bacterium]